MKRSVWLALVLVVLSPIALNAQDFPKAEVFGGYMLLHDKGTTTNGGEGAFEYNFTPFAGFVAEVGYGKQTLKGTTSLGATSVEESEWLYLFGPRVGYRAKQFRVFAHVLFGANRLSFKGTVADMAAQGRVDSTDFSMAMGGGVDVSVHKHVSIRLAQIDWLESRLNATQSMASGWTSQLRYAGGIVFKFGGK